MRIGIIVSILSTLCGVIGWVQCVVKFFMCDFASATAFKAEVIYGIGMVIPPLGAILGYFDFGK